MEKPWMDVRYGKVVSTHIFLFLLLQLTGCGPTLSSPERLREFERAGPIESEENISGSAGVKVHTGPYRVIAGDILEFQMPAAIRLVTSDASDSFQRVEPYSCRVSETGTITMPIIGEMLVAGKTVAEIESSVINAYYPKYVVTPPMVVCEVKKYRRENERIFTVMGLVNHPNAFPYPPDVQYNLMEALAFAGGLDMVADPHYLKVYRQDADGRIVSATFSIESKSLADAYRVTVKPGDVIYVDHTLHTRTNKFLSDVLHITVGADIHADNGN